MADQFVLNPDIIAESIDEEVLVFWPQFPEVYRFEGEVAGFLRALIAGNKVESNDSLGEIVDHLLELDVIRRDSEDSRFVPSRRHVILGAGGTVMASVLALPLPAAANSGPQTLSGTYLRLSGDEFLFSLSASRLGDDEDEAGPWRLSVLSAATGGVLDRGIWEWELVLPELTGSPTVQGELTLAPGYDVVRYLVNFTERFQG